MNLNERISKIIEYSELSSSEFADEIDVQRSSISHITSGRNKPSLEFIIKIKNRFPELQWDWLVNGEGEMLRNAEENEISTELGEVPKPTSLPDLFTLIDDDSFGITESEDRISKNIIERESNIPIQEVEKAEITDSQRLEKETQLNKEQSIENQNDKVKRIVLFYESGKFESFEP